MTTKGNLYLDFIFHSNDLPRGRMELNSVTLY